MYVIRRHMEGITLNPYEYVIDDEGELVVFDSPEEALKEINNNFESITCETEEDAWEKLGVDIHKIKQTEMEDFNNAR